MSDDNAHKILTVFAYFRVRPGHDLVSSDFLAIGDRQRWSVKDLDSGLYDAERNGWIEKAARGWRLTSTGFEEAARSSEHLLAR